MKTDKIKETLGQLKDRISALDKKVKIIAVIVAVAVIAGAVIIAYTLNQTRYDILFSELADEEATEIVAKLQESGVDYQYKGGGTILVDEKEVDAARADLAYEGYPKNGFAYDVYIDNAGGMVTDSEKEMYKIYQLQNRIGATISLFDGVKDAKVTIATGRPENYVLSSGTGEEDSSASVVVTMKNGAELQQKQAAAIQRLVAKSVENMSMENVAVFDQNGVELSDDPGGDTSTPVKSELQALVERKIEQKVINVLVPFFGDGNIRVSAHGDLNMEKILRETTTYSTPEKVDENDKNGFISNEQGTNEQGSAAGGASGVAGTEQNADVSEYQNGEDGNGGTYQNESYDREYLYNQVKEQTEINPGVMDDLTVSISINGEGFGTLNIDKIRSLVANATGISSEDAPQKIAAVAAPFYTEAAETSSGMPSFREFVNDNWMILLGAGAVFLVVLLLTLIIKRKLKKRKLKKLAKAQGDSVEAVQIQEQPQTPPVEKVDILTIQNDRSRELRDGIREFADTNPEISAQMLRTWLNGGERDE